MTALCAPQVVVRPHQLLDDHSHVGHHQRRLKICSWDECAWAYYDHSKNRSRAWCEYGCGNKVKTRAYRARQRAEQLGNPGA